VADSLYIMPFGKHKGLDIEEVETSYLEWLVDQDWFANKFEKGFEAVKEELKYRENFGDT
jgi:uncharacterized protein (DUF3820 family)